MPGVVPRGGLRGDPGVDERRARLELPAARPAEHVLAVVEVEAAQARSPGRAGGCGLERRASARAPRARRRRGRTPGRGRRPQPGSRRAASGRRGAAPRSLAAGRATRSAWSGQPRLTRVASRVDGRASCAVTAPGENSRSAVLARRGAEPRARAPRRRAAAASARAKRGGVARRRRAARDAVLDRVDEPADRGRDDRPPVGHRLARDHAVALAPRRDADDRRALVVGAELGRRDEADRLGHAVAQRAVADDHARQALRRLEELEDALLLAQPAGEEDVRRLVRLADLGRDLDAVRDHAHLARAERARAASARNVDAASTTPRARGRSGRTSHGRAARELDVRPPDLEHERLPGRERRERRREPVGVHDVGVARRAPRGRARTRRGTPARAATSHGAARRFWTIPPP